MSAADEAGGGAVPVAATRAHWWILVVIAGAQLMVVLDSTIMIIALPSAQHSLGFSNTDRQWVVTAYTLAFGGFLLLGGRISDMVGPKRTLMAGVLGFALASAVGGAAQTTLMLIGARGLQGLFGALLAPSVLSMMTSTFTDPRNGAGPSASTPPSPSPVRPSASSSAASSPSTSTGAGACTSTCRSPRSCSSGPPP